MRWHSVIDILRLLANSHMRFAFVGVEIRALPLMNDNRPATRKTTPSHLSLPFASLQHCKQPRTASCQIMLPAWRVNTLREDFCLRPHHVYRLLNPYVLPISPF